MLAGPLTKYWQAPGSCATSYSSKTRPEYVAAGACDKEKPYGPCLEYWESIPFRQMVRASVLSPCVSVICMCLYTLWPMRASVLNVCFCAVSACLCGTINLYPFSVTNRSEVENYAAH